MMTAEELWQRSGINGKYEAWAFGDSADQLADLVLKGIKTATCSALCTYEAKKQPLPQVGEYNIILNSSKQAVCITRTTKVYIASFDEIGEAFAFREGEGDRTLDYWRKVHQEFFSNELKTIGKAFHSDMKLVCEEFEVV